MAQAIMPDMGTAVRRFPMAVSIALLFTALHLFDADKVLELDRQAWMRLSAGLCTAFFWSVSASLYSEARRSSPLARFALEAAGLAVIAALYIFHQFASFSPALFLVAAGILTGLSPYLALGAANAAFWQFNHRLWLGGALALAGAILLSGGISLIIETLELLFEITFPGATHEKVWIVGLGLVGPLNWLSLAPAEFTEEVPEGAQDEFTSRAVAIIVKYILAPLLLVYTAILYVYAVKIGLDGVLPKGRLGPMILAYGAMGMLAVLLAWPTRAAGGPLVAFFWRYWFWLTAGPVGLLFLAAYARIAQYGVTDERYLVALAGVWLGGLAIWFAFRRGARDLRALPLSLCLALVIASAGPWGAIGLSVASQKAELATLLESNGRLKDGRIVPEEKSGKLARGDARRAGSILRYLQRRERLDVLSEWFVQLKDNPFQGDAGPDETLRAVTQIIGAPLRAVPLAKAEYFNFTAGRPAETGLTGYTRLIGPVVIGGNRYEISLPLREGRPVGGQLQLRLENAVLTLTSSGRERARFDLSATARTASELRRKDQAPARSEDRMQGPLQVKSSGGDLDAVLLIDSLRGRIGTGYAEVRLLRGWVLLGRE